jgi:hypothetical protein
MTDPYAKAKAEMLELANQSIALCNWFESQGLTQAQSVKLMGYLLGTMAGDVAESIDDGFAKLEVIHLLSLAQCANAFDVKHNRGKG